jgi:penicillin-binding protein 1C
METIFKLPKKIYIIAPVLAAVTVGVFLWKTYTDLQPIPSSLILDASDTRKVQLLDRNNIPLTVTYANQWNIHDYVPLHDIPSFLQQAFIVSEDKRFLGHSGIDWLARLHAFWQNLKALRPLRGASTISEQVIRMLHPRPRTVWSRWLEGLEASQLEDKFSKIEILEFYLNQVPYAAQRRGVVQAAYYYFDRDLDTLSQKEMLALVVLVRAPGRMDLHKKENSINSPLRRLADRLFKLEAIDHKQYVRVKTDPLQLEQAQLAAQAGHFAQHLYRNLPPKYLQTPRAYLRTTLDAEIQTKVQTILNQRLKDLKNQQVHNGAALVIDHQTHEVLAWVNGGEVHDGGGLPGGWIDAVVTPRQPGSTLKPFLYAQALQKGWTAATVVDDLPLTKPVGLGLHIFRNYSRIHYGPLVLRDALGNSLNIPAVRTVQFVGVKTFLDCLQDLGISSLQGHPEFYGEGLALGNGEITLFELVQAYSVLAGRGLYDPLKVLLDDASGQYPSRKIFSFEVASIIANILSDPQARKLEFGAGGLLHLPVQTAVKTGTSNDYRDAWAIGFNHRYTVGVWMGNLNHKTMNGITGSRGPALVLRAIFTELNRHQETRSLYLSPRLVKFEVCRDSGRLATDQCIAYREWFVPGTEPAPSSVLLEVKKPYQLLRPTPGLQLAMDPRIPDDHEAFSLELENIPPGATVHWYVDGEWIATTSTPRYIWPMQRGEHEVQALVLRAYQNQPVRTPWIRFVVK